MPNLKDEIIKEIIKEIRKDKEIDLENVSEVRLRKIIKSKIKEGDLADSSKKIDRIAKDILNKIISQGRKTSKSIDIKALDMVKDLGNSTKIYAVLRVIIALYFVAGIGNSIYFIGTSLFLFILGNRIEKLNDKNNKNNIKILTFSFLFLIILSPGIDKLVALIFFIYSLVSLNKWKKLTKNKTFKKNLIEIDYKLKKRDWIVGIIVFIFLLVLGVWVDIQNGLYDDYLTSSAVELSIIQKNRRIV